MSLSPDRGQRRAEHDEHAGAARRCARREELLHGDHAPGRQCPHRAHPWTWMRGEPADRTAEGIVAHGPSRRPTQPWIRMLSPGPPSGKYIGWLVVDELVIELRQQPAGVVVEAAVAGAGGVEGEGAAAHRRRPTKVGDAAAAGGGVAGEGAAGHRQLSEEVVLDAAA